MSVDWSSGGRPCGATGPYYREQRSVKGLKLVIVACNRPQGHDGDFHAHATQGKGVAFTWGRDGRPFTPAALQEGVSRGASDRL